MTNTTFSLRPGETGYVTLRGPYDRTQMGTIASAVTPVLIPHPTDPSSPGPVAPLAITNAGRTLPDAAFGVPYSATVSVFGGKAPYSFGAGPPGTSTGLPSGLSIDGMGSISGTPQQAGTFTPTIIVSDSSQPIGTVTRSFSLAVAKATPVSDLGQPGVHRVRDRPWCNSAQRDRQRPRNLHLHARGRHDPERRDPDLSVSFTPNDTGNYNPSSATASLTVAKAATVSTAYAATAPNPSTVNEVVTFTATVAGPAGTATPTGTVTFKDGATTLGSAALSAGSAIYTTSTLTVGSHSITAQYVPDAVAAFNLVGSTSPALAQTVQATYAFTGFLTPLQPAGTFAAPSYSGTQTFGSGVPVSRQAGDASGNFVGNLGTATWLRAYANSSAQCKGAPAAGAAYTVLYSPTTGAKGNSTFRYGSNQYNFNWDTGSTVVKGCYTLALQLERRQRREGHERAVEVRPECRGNGARAGGGTSANDEEAKRCSLTHASRGACAPLGSFPQSLSQH